LDSVAAEIDSSGLASEVLVLDNASTDHSAEAAEDHPVTTRVVKKQLRCGKATNDSELLKLAEGKYGLLLNEDSELLPGATKTLFEALENTPDAGAAGTQIFNPQLDPQPSAWRFPSVGSALAGALMLHRIANVQSKGDTVRAVDWAQSAALLVRRSAAKSINYLDPEFFVYSDEVDFCKRLSNADWQTLYVPEAKAIHHEQLATGGSADRRVVEFCRNRDLYMRKHHGAAQAAAVRILTAIPYLLRAAAATVLPNHDAGRYLKHVKATLLPKKGSGIREAAAEFNRQQSKL